MAPSPSTVGSSFVVGLLAWSVAIAASPGAYAATPAAAGERAKAACGSPNPFLVSSRFADNVHGRVDSAATVLYAFRDTPGDAPDAAIPLASYGQLGTVYGLAFDPTRNQVYAAAYLKRGSLFPPGGPGAIARVDLATGQVEPWVKLPAGPANVHRLLKDQDAPAAALVGRLSLGDIDIDPDGGSLFAANLFDGRIYRLALPDGSVDTTFAHGASGLKWGRGARPFGLAVQGEWIYHGVVEPGTLEAPSPIGHIYRSGFDGSAMTEVAAFPLDPGGADAPLAPWTGSDRPVISDIAFRPNGDMVIGVRNLALDGAVSELPRRLGDLLPGEHDGDAWRIDLVPEHYDDNVAGADESLTGGLAALPGLDIVVGAAHPGQFDEDSATAVWFDGTTGDGVRYEPILANADPQAPPPLAGSGDVEVLCSPLEPLDSSLVATATADAARIATATAEAVGTMAAIRATAVQATMTALVPTLTAMAPTQEALATAAAGQKVAPAQGTSAARDYERITAACASDDPFLAVAYQLRHDERRKRNSSVAYEGAARHAVAAFNQAEPLNALAEGSQVGSVYGLAYDDLRGHLYVAAFNPVHAGPAGPGAIYRIELSTGKVYPWAMLPAPRAPRSRRPNVVLSGYGDIEIDWADSQLFAVSLWDRAIYRLALPDGTLLGIIPNGASAEPWADDAYPFAVGFHDGWLYQGVVPDPNRPMPNRPAVIYRSRPDGTEMTEVARFKLNYRRSGQDGSHASAIVADIEFRPNGEPIIGLRDGTVAATGDLVPAQVRRDAWVPDLARERYDLGNTTVTGALAGFADADRVVSTGSGLGRKGLDFGAIWYDNQSGKILSRRILAPRKMRTMRIPSHDPRKPPTLVTLSDYEILGDVESLCRKYVPTVTPTPSPTVTPSATNTATSTATPTPVPEPIYLPVTLDEACDKRNVHADVVLVIDVSTSMRSATRDGRSKVEAVQDAARVFIDLMDFGTDGGHDQVAVAAFNSTAWMVRPLDTDASALRASIDELSSRLSAGTRLDLAVVVGMQGLETSARMASNTPVVILLTDGLPNGVPTMPGGTQEDTVLAKAALARAAGVRVYTIGVGEQDAADPAYRINAALLRAMATEPSMFFQTLDAEELSGIYRQIAYTLGCPPSSFWGGR